MTAAQASPGPAPPRRSPSARSSRSSADRRWRRPSSTPSARAGPPPSARASAARRSAFGARGVLGRARGRLPKLRGVGRRDVVLFGVALAGVNLLFYAALDRLPLGIAVTLEFVGALGGAVVRSRRRGDLIWALLAAIGILLLSDGGGGGI